MATSTVKRRKNYMSETWHVAPSGYGGWTIRKSNSIKPLKVYPIKSEAVVTARLHARNDKTQLYVHGKDGQIETRNNYGSESLPSVKD